MAAHTDFEYLRSLALSPADRAVLDRIAADRETVLQGGRLPEPGEYLRLSVRVPEAAGHSAEPRYLTLNLRSDLAPASLDTFLEIFRDEAHMKVPGFRGETSAAGGFVLDLGAHEGYYALRMKLSNPTLQVRAVEPVSENMALLRLNLEANGVGDVETLEAAVGAESGHVVLETLPHVGTVASTDIMAFPRPWIKRDRIRRRRVPVTTIAAILADPTMRYAPTLLKLDVEGSEDEVLSAGADVLPRFERVVVECHGEEKRDRVASVMAEAGFACVYAEEKRSGDLYFERREAT